MKYRTATQNFFDQRASTWHNQIDSVVTDRLKKILIEKIPKLNSPVLDVGSGTGIILPILSASYGDNFTVIEVDLSWNMLKENQDKNYRNPPLGHIQADTHYLPFGDKQFGSIICFGSFAHFDDKTTVLKDFYRVIHTTGLLIILHLMCHRRLNKMHQNVGGAVENDRLSSVHEISHIIKSAGFKVSYCEESENIYFISAQK
jgi:ubiquinone/menaquinone biosynthesis C-methylase UbiE